MVRRMCRSCVFDSRLFQTLFVTDFSKARGLRVCAYTLWNVTQPGRATDRVFGAKTSHRDTAWPIRWQAASDSALFKLLSELQEKERLSGFGGLEESWAIRPERFGESDFKLQPGDLETSRHDNVQHIFTSGGACENDWPLRPPIFQNFHVHLYTSLEGGCLLTEITFKFGMSMAIVPRRE